jgi:16S rRNA (adenine1518-N6/adenine1519-N6)-dimethyltransferase
MKLVRKKDQYIISSKAVLRRIVEEAELSTSDTVLEVGCGTGNLTREILRNAGKVVGIEKDNRFVKLLEEKFKDELEDGRFEIIEGDALKVDFPHFNKFVSNIPYSISSELTFKLLRHKFDLAIVMYQKEFAERMIAKSGKKYGRLSVAIRAFCSPKIVSFVSRWAFKPVPKVDSAIVKLIPNPEFHVENLEIFNELLRVSFSMRRKKFEKSLKKFLEISGKIEIYDEFSSHFVEILNKRTDQIAPEMYAEVSNKLSEFLA